MIKFIAAYFILGIFICALIIYSYDKKLYGHGIQIHGRSEIDSQQLIDILNSSTITDAVTSHSQRFYIETKWGFKYWGTWNRGVGIVKINPTADRSDILNLISGYDKHYNWQTSITCE